MHFGLFQLALRAIWNNLSKNLFRTTRKIDVLDVFKPNEVAAELSHTNQKKNWLFVGAVVLFGQRVNSDERRKVKENHQVWNNFGSRSPTVGGRGRPPFVENIARNLLPHCLSLGGRLFLRGFGSRGGGRGPLRALSSYMGIYYKNIQKFSRSQKLALRFSWNFACVPILVSNEKV